MCADRPSDRPAMHCYIDRCSELVDSCKLLVNRSQAGRKSLARSSKVAPSSCASRSQHAPNGTKTKKGCGICRRPVGTPMGIEQIERLLVVKTKRPVRTADLGQTNSVPLRGELLNSAEDGVLGLLFYGPLEYLNWKAADCYRWQCETKD